MSEYEQPSFDLSHVTSPPASQEVTVEFAVQGSITGIPEKIVLGVDRYGRGFIDVIRGEDTDEWRRAIEKIIKEKKHRPDTPNVPGEMTPRQLLHAKHLEGYRRYHLRSDGHITVDGGRNGRTYESNIESPSSGVIPDVEYDEHGTALERNAVKIADVIREKVASGVFTHEQGDMIAAIPLLAFRQVVITISSLTPTVAPNPPGHSLQ